MSTRRAKRIAEYANSSRAASTVAAEKTCLGYWRRWCDANGRDADRPDPGDLALYLYAHRDDWAPATLRNHRCAIDNLAADNGHQRPSDDPFVQELTKALERYRRATYVPPTRSVVAADAVETMLTAPLGRPEELIQTLRLRAVLLLRHELAITPPAAMRIGRSDVRRAANGLVVRCDGRDHHIRDVESDLSLHAQLSRYLDTFDATPREGDCGLFRWSRESRQADSPLRATKHSTAAANIRAAARRAADRAGVDLDPFERPSDRRSVDDELTALLRHCYRYRLADLRDRSIAAVTAIRGSRHNDLVAQATIEHMTRGEGAIVIHLERSKGDRASAGEASVVVRHGRCDSDGLDQVPSCPACLLELWLCEGRIETGLVWPSLRGVRPTGRALDVRSRNRALRRTAGNAGVPDASDLSSHGHRRGLVIDATRSGTAPATTKDQVGHHSLPTTARYHHVSDPFEDAAHPGA